MKTIIIDDVFYNIEIDEDEFQCLHNTELDECLGILLTERQLDEYIGETTSREFCVSDKRIKEFEDYIRDDNKNNIWRADNNRVKQWHLDHKK